MDIWRFQSTLTRRLLVWSGLSILLGLPALLLGAFARGLGVQFIAWGLIDAAIAFFGMLMAKERRADPFADPALEQGKLRRILWINTGADVLYVAIGLALQFTLGLRDPFWRGGGAGILIQGGFLFFFDLLHAIQLKEGEHGQL